MEKINIIATKFECEKFVRMVFDIIPREYRGVRLDSLDWALRELKRNAIFYYINFSGQLDWAFRLEKDELCTIGLISNEAFLFMTKCIYGDIKKPINNNQ